MNIVVIQDHLRSGGTERQSILLARAFTAAGHPTTLVNFRPGGALEPSTGDLRREILQPCDTRLDWFAPGLIRTVGALAPDVILCMGRMANCHGARLGSRLPQATVVATLRTGRALRTIFSPTSLRTRAGSRSVQSRSEMPIVMVRMSRFSSSIICSVSMISSVLSRGMVGSQVMAQCTAPVVGRDESRRYFARRISPIRLGSRKPP